MHLFALLHAPLTLTLALLLGSACSEPTASGGAENTAALCGNGRDDDGDNFVDCADQDCWRLAICSDTADSGDSGDTQGAEVIPPSDTATDEAQGDATPGEVDVPSTADTPDTTGPTCDPCTGKGSLKGRVCAPNQNVYVNDAAVSVTGIGCDGEPFTIETTSSADGTYYLLDIPCGEHLLEIKKGSFAASFPVRIRPGELHDVTGAATKLCFGSTAVKIAVLGGTWDDLGGLLEQLGFRYDFFNDRGDDGANGSIVELLADRARLFSYDIVFAECGATLGWLPKDEPAVMPNVKDFVLQGGSLYMSDYAWALGEWSFPDKVEWYRDDDPLSMGTSNSPQAIPSGTKVTATVVDGSLASHLGKTSIPIEFDQGPQIAPLSVANGAFAHVVGNIIAPLQLDVRNAPLALSYVPAQGAGRVIYTNFHNDAQTTSDMLTILRYLVFTL